MRLLADENIPLETVRALRATGHDVFSATEAAAGSADEVLLQRADAERRLLVTFDRDFGELAARQGRAASAGILLLRFVPRSPTDVTEVLEAVLARSDIIWERRMSVVDRHRLRQRPL